MQKFLALLTALCILGAPLTANAGHYQNNGRYVGAPSSAVVALFAQFPEGGTALAEAIAQLLANNPSLADDVAFVAKTRGNRAQKEAAGIGMGLAAAAFAANGDTATADAILAAAQLSGDPIIIASAEGAFSASGSGNLATGLFLPPINPATAGGNVTGFRCSQQVSPNRPC
jgi:hypothetical protein